MRDDMDKTTTIVEWVHCDCAAWRDNIVTVDSGLHMYKEIGFDASISMFVFCPWCGKMLQATMNQSSPQQHEG